MSGFWQINSTAFVIHFISNLLKCWTFVPFNMACPPGCSPFLRRGYLKLFKWHLKHTNTPNFGVRVNQEGNQLVIVLNFQHSHPRWEGKIKNSEKVVSRNIVRWLLFQRHLPLILKWGKKLMLVYLGLGPPSRVTLLPIKTIFGR